MLIFLLSMIMAFAKTPKEILEAAIQKQRINNSIQSIEMILIAKNGGKQQRNFELRIRRDKEIVRSYTRFTYPAEIANTQLVVIDRPDKSDPQLLYLPALKRVQRIAGRSRRGSFMGSDFSYADLELTIDKEASHSILKEDKTQWVIETKSSNHSLYSKWISHISKKSSLPEKMEYYDKKGKKLKTLLIEETRQEGNSSIPIQSRVRNHQRGTQTLLKIKSIQINVPLDKLPLSMFSAGYMKQNE